MTETDAEALELGAVGNAPPDPVPVDDAPPVLEIDDSDPLADLDIDADAEGEPVEGAPEGDDDAPPETLEDALEAEAESEAEGDEAEAGSVKVHFGGRELEGLGDLPPEAAAKVQAALDDTWAAHTRKSKELAEERGRVQKVGETVQRLAQLNDAGLRAFAQAQMLQDRIPQMEQRVAQLRQSGEADQYRLASDQLNEMRQGLQSLYGQVQAAENEIQQTQDRQRAERHQAGADQIAKSHSETEVAEILEFAATQFGVPLDKVKSVYGESLPQFEMVRDALRYRKAMANIEAKRKAGAPKVAPKKPMQSRVSAAGSNAANPLGWSDRQWDAALGL
jgi:TolA-binding protein